MAFFLPSMCMKLLNLGVATCYTAIITFSHTKSLPLTAFAVMAIPLTLLVYQVTLHTCLGFSMKEDSVFISILANLTTNARPKHAEEEVRVTRFLKIETTVSTVIYSALATFNATYIGLHDNKNIHFAFIGFGFILLHLVFTQLYLWTSAGRRLLFPKAMETDQTVVNTLTEAPKTELRIVKWIILIISIAITVGLFCYVGYILTKGRTPYKPSDKPSVFK